MSLLVFAVSLLAGCAAASNDTRPAAGGDATCAAGGDATCAATAAGLWSAALEEWATCSSVHSDRHGRVMALPSTKGYYVAERLDNPYLSPPPPPPPQHIPTQGHAQSPSAPGYMPGHVAHGNMPMHKPPHAMHVPQGYKEWEGASQPGGGKIVNRPTKPYKDKFKPSYPPPTPPEQRPGPNAADRADEPPRKQVTETDLYLLSAIEKLVYRVDLMEKRLRKMEEGVHYLLAGVESKPDPCPANYSRVGGACYAWSAAALDWKGASLACRRAGAALLELADDAQRNTLYSKLLSDKQLRGNDFWTGGLNPGLLWIWSHSAKPVEPGATNATAIAGDGRCLALVADPARTTYAYRGRDCAAPHRYICQKEDSKEKIGNDIERVARTLHAERVRKSKLLWDEDK